MLGVEQCVSSDLTQPPHPSDTPQTPLGAAREYRDSQGHRDNQGHPGTIKDTQGQSGTIRDSQGQSGTIRDNQGHRDNRGYPGIGKHYK